MLAITAVRQINNNFFNVFEKPLARARRTGTVMTTKIFAARTTNKNAKKVFACEAERFQDIVHLHRDGLGLDAGTADS